MSQPRSVGLLLLLAGVLTFLGTRVEALPPAAFWAGLILYPIGGYLFFQGSRAALRQAERQAARRVDPGIRNRTLEDFARSRTRAAAPQESTPNELVLDPRMEVERPAPALLEIEPEAEAEFQVSSDVSVPVAIQERANLADQIEKLRRLREAGIISEDEFAIAKAKLLR